MGGGSPIGDRRMRGFEPAAGLLRDTIRRAGESRGFAVARLLTHWAEVAGADIAEMCRPVRVGYGREGIGATLTLLVAGAQAPVLQMMLPQIRERVNACYGYNAIARIQITQTAAEGFAEAQAPFAAPKPRRTSAKPTAEMHMDVHDEELRAALEGLARNVISREGQEKG